MNVIERSNKRPLMVVPEIEASDAKKNFPTNGEATSESDSSTEVRSCKTVYRNRCKKLVVSDTSLNVVSFIDTGKDDRDEPIASECFADKKDDKGTDFFLRDPTDFFSLRSRTYHVHRRYLCDIP